MFINGRKFVPKRFSSGELKLLNEDLIVNDKKVEILYDGSDITIFELFIIIKYYKDNGYEVYLTLNYLPYQRMNHNNGYEVETLKYVSELFNGLNLNGLYVCEPHCDLEYFNNSKKISIVEPILKLATKDIVEYKLFYIDKGILNKCKGLSDDYLYAQKTRDKKTGLIDSYEIVGDVTGVKNVVIVDDIISSGDTVMCAISKLLELGDFNIYIVCGHFEINKYNNRIFDIKNVKCVYSSNSLTKISNNKKLKLFDIREIVYEKNNNGWSE